ncbi:DUF2934 domain-containing protein [Rhizobium oryziradicis]|uniref:DUF2934 domain-containing protein n=1 Tax=Rhizobium oryziradicis TaxID=1867956 RepID=A0A1Q8ZVD0_9HYPH|nr:DUF2934 domain-containing protein [Rhizobium oryziradicis]OLP45985.1 hypothetical protein BJF95_14815 [Rhizobium oryziradicis]
MSIENDRIRARAYELWQNDGCKQDRSVDYWLQAEQELQNAGETEAREGNSAPVVSYLNEKKRASQKPDSLESAIEETFPASDPMAISSPAVAGSPKKKSSTR